jgi:GNAT superfamily N-acetyltransferase
MRARSVPPNVRDDQAALTTLLARDPEALLVAEHEGIVVGALIAASDGWRGNVYRLAVLPDRRRRGIAIELVRVGENRLRATGARRISALVAEADEAAVSLWRAAGYALDNCRPLRPQPVTPLPDPPLGAKLDWTPARRPERTRLRGSHALVRPVDAAADAEPLYAVSHPPDGDPAIWTYLPDGPYDSSEQLRRMLARAMEADDAVYFTLATLIP